MEVGFEFRKENLLTFGSKPYQFYTNGKFEWKLGRNGVGFKGLEKILTIFKDYFSPAPFILCP
jgi:hypothetical protein